MRRDTRQTKNEECVRRLNEAAERGAELSRIKLRLWQRFAAAMQEMRSVATKAPSHLGATNSAPSSSKA